MDLTSLTSMSVGGIVEELIKLKLEGKELEIPKFVIPNWPSGVVVHGYLGRRDYRVPVLQENNLLKWRTGRHKISFRVTGEGVIGFCFHFSFGRRRPVFDIQYGIEYFDQKIRYVSSDYYKNSSRIATVMLFDQFKVDVFLRVISELENNFLIHNQVVEEVKKAFEPFMPFIVMDQLTK